MRLCGVTADLAAESHGGERPIFKSWQWQEIESADLQRLERKGQVEVLFGKATEGPSTTIITIHSHYDAMAHRNSCQLLASLSVYLCTHVTKGFFFPF